MVQHIPDCIFIDFRDPGFDPVFFCRTLKDNSRFQHVPILYLSLQITCDLACNLLSAGAYDCLERDVDSKLLAAKIFAMMGLKRDLEELGKLRRFQSFGDSLGVFAHDLNNPLSVAVGNVYWLKRNIIDQSQTLRLGRVSEALDRITHLIVKARGVRESLDKDINTTDVDLSAPSKK
jgi:DNA-binding response OmpR family regulator